MMIPVIEEIHVTNMQMFCLFKPLVRKPEWDPVMITIKIQMTKRALVHIVRITLIHANYANKQFTKIIRSHSTRICRYPSISHNEKIESFIIRCRGYRQNEHGK
jgi:hypothetical protein